MPQAYWIAHVIVTDEDVYAQYRSQAFAAVTSHGGDFVARGGRYAQMEGEDHAWNTVAVFPSYDDAITCYNSAGYQAALKLAAQSSRRSLVIVEGAE